MRSVLPAVWSFPSVDDAAAADLALKLDLPPVLARLLCMRASADIQEASRFLDPSMTDLSDPFRISGMRAAADRICCAIANKESILVHGDYDADGIAGTAVLLHVLADLGGSARPWLPNRMRDGYGFTPASLSRCLGETHYRPQLIITADCGTNAVAAVRLAEQSGIDVVITDHHEPGGELAPALAVVNPKLDADQSLHMLAGVGVAFKLCQALFTLCREKGIEKAGAHDLRSYLDLVALGTVADIAPLLGENRILVGHGLKQMNEAAPVGLLELMKVAGMRQPLDATNIGFGLAPRINAAGRLGEAGNALELLMTENHSRARALALELDAANRERQAIELQIRKQALDIIEPAFDPARSFGLAVGKRGWHQGVIGIVASNLVARFWRPAAVVAFDENGCGKGSCRGIAGASLLTILEACSDSLESFGGHDAAAGIEVHEDKFDAFCEKFNAAAAAVFSEKDLTPTLAIAGWLELEEITPRFMGALERLHPFGAENPEPVWAVRKVSAMQMRKVGRNHLRFEVAANGSRCRAIAFNRDEASLPAGLMDIAFRLRRDLYAGPDQLQLQVVDLQEASL